MTCSSRPPIQESPRDPSNPGWDAGDLKTLADFPNLAAPDGRGCRSPRTHDKGDLYAAMTGMTAMAETRIRGRCAGQGAGNLRAIFAGRGYGERFDDIYRRVKAERRIVRAIRLRTGAERDEILFEAATVEGALAQPAGPMDSDTTRFCIRRMGKRSVRYRTRTKPPSVTAVKQCAFRDICSADPPTPPTTHRPT